ncbi:alcohol dehydrogenase class IV [Lysobacter sp. HA35]
MRLHPAALAFFVMLAGVAFRADACTLCHSPTARLVRDHVLHHGFAAHATAVALPLLLLVAVIALAARDRRHPDPSQ